MCAGRDIADETGRWCGIEARDVFEAFAALQDRGVFGAEQHPCAGGFEAVELADVGPGAFVGSALGQPVAEQTLSGRTLAHPRGAAHEHEIERLEQLAVGFEYAIKVGERNGGDINAGVNDADAVEAQPDRIVGVEGGVIV